MSDGATAPGPADPAAASASGAHGRVRVAIVGMPNTGKSTFFNRLTGARARIGNWPGVTVDLLSSPVILGRPAWSACAPGPRTADERWRDRAGAGGPRSGLR